MVRSFIYLRYRFRVRILIFFYSLTHSLFIYILGSCWAFSVVAAIESFAQISTGSMPSLSEQQLVDCDTASSGCEGGYLNKAYEYVINTGGLTTSDDYPYIGSTAQCRGESNPAVTINGYTTIPSFDENELSNAVERQPVSVVIDSSGDEFRFYNGGVYECSGCDDETDHGVAVIGYEQDYWIIKNSWGDDWGEGGYMKMLRNTCDGRGTCGITEQGYFPY